MWQVIARYRDVDYIIHDDRITDEECKILSPALTVEDNKSGTLEFTICPSNNGYNKIYPMLTECRVLKNGKIIWFGRVLTADSDFYKRLKIHCEGGLSYLCDFYYPAEALPNPNYKYAFPQAVDGIMYWYNETLTDSKFISYGLFRSFTGKTVAFDGKEVVGRYDDDFIKKAGSDNYRAWPYSERSSMTILDWLLASTEYYNGHLFVTRETASDGTWVQYLNFKSGYNTWVGQTIRFGENLLDYTKSIDGSNFHTAVRPYGNIEVTNGDQSETIDIDVRYILKKYFNDAEKQDFVVTNSATDPSQNYVMTLDKSRNIAYCHSFETNMPDVDDSMQTWADIYGIICKPFEANFVGSEFVGRLISHFRETKPESMVIEIRAVDMDLLGATSSDIEILDMIHVVSKPHNVDGYFPVTKIEYHLDDPSQTVYTIDTGAVESQSSVTGSSSVSVDTKITSSGYKHPTYKENSLGFYKFANDAIGSVTDAQPVTKKDITDLGIPDKDTNTTYKLSKTGNAITLTGTDESSISVTDSDTTYELSLPTYANQKEPPVPMLSLNGSDGSKNEQVIPYTYTVLEDIVYEEFSGYKFGGKYRSIADLAYVVPYSKFANTETSIITADLYLETKMSDGMFSDSAYCFEHTESSSTIRRMHDNDENYSGDFAETKDWAVLNDEMVLSNPKRLVKIIRIGVPDEVFNRLTDSGCNRSRLMYCTGRDGAIARPISYYSDINIDASSQARSYSVYSLSRTDVKKVAFTGDYNDLSNKPSIPDISGKQDKSTAVTHTANTAVGSATKPVYITKNGVATPISHSINADVPANAKFTDTTYNDATQSAHGLMTAADKKKLDGMDLWIAGANNAAKWYRLGTLVSSGDFSNAVIRIWSGDGANGRANQNASFEIQIKDGWQSTTSATKACGVTVYRINCRSVKVKVIPTAHDTYTVWVYLPWLYWNGNYAVYGKYKSWTSQQLIQSNEPEGTGSDTAYYDQAFLTSTVAKANEATTLTESAWTDVPETNISPRYGKNIKYLKTGNTVYVRGSISFSASLNNPCCGTMPSDLLPDDYQDHVFTAWHLSSGVPTAYPVVLAKDGKITLMNPTSTANWFVAGKAYNFNFNYHIN